MEELTIELMDSSKAVRNAYYALRQAYPQFAAVVMAEAHDEDGYALIAVRFYYRSGKPQSGLDVYKVRANDKGLCFIRSIEG